MGPRRHAPRHPPGPRCRRPPRSRPVPGAGNPDWGVRTFVWSLKRPRPFPLTGLHPQITLSIIKKGFFSMSFQHVVVRRSPTRLITSPLHQHPLEPSRPHPRQSTPGCAGTGAPGPPPPDHRRPGGRGGGCGRGQRRPSVPPSCPQPSLSSSDSSPLPIFCACLSPPPGRWLRIRCERQNSRKTRMWSSRFKTRLKTGPTSPPRASRQKAPASWSSRIRSGGMRIPQPGWARLGRGATAALEPHPARRLPLVRPQNSIFFWGGIST